MKSEWKECILGDLGDVVGGATPSTKVSANYENGGISWITPKDLASFSGRYIARGERNITEQGLKSCSAQLMPQHSVLFSSRAPIGYVAIADRELCTNQGFKSIVPNANVDYLFLYYLLTFHKDAIENLGSGTTFKEVSAKVMRGVKVKVPSLPTQRKIAAVLSSLDDKIETNNAICRNLEDQADAFYKQHFVSGEKSSWNEGKLSDLIDVKYGKDHKKLADGTIPVYGSGGLMRYAERALYESESVLIPRKGTLNNVMLVMESFWTVDTMFYSVMKVKNAAKFVFHFLKGKDLASMNAGSAVPSMTTEILNSIELRLPPKAVLADFEHNVAPIYQTIATKKRENDCLAALRDTLLPRLMSGKLNVSAVKL